MLKRMKQRISKMDSKKNWVKEINCRIACFPISILLLNNFLNKKSKIVSEIKFIFIKIALILC